MAGIIKAGGQTGNRKAVQPVAFNLEDMHGKALAYLDSAREEAEKIVAQANVAAGQVIKTAEQQGRGKALEAATQTATAKVDQQLNSLLPALQKTADLIQQEKEAWMRHWEQRAIDLSIAIAERLIQRELREDPEIPVSVIRQALELAAGQEHVQLHLNPLDVEALGERAQILARQINNLASLEIVADDAISPGGCLVRSEFGEIDHQFETQLERIKQELSE